ncbi:MAG: hypothetical protein EOM50_08050 [Erysipelotrichia bacterium]|nr:hypothetical protein [Erysipelotrichia bacterium]NCC54823.1 hypothetical protein [Erysipelotrichia bacterium]
MSTFKLYLGSNSIEKYLNKKAKRGFELESITPFTLFFPMRIDYYKFKKIKNIGRTYNVSNNSNEKLREVFRLCEKFRYFFFLLKLRV